MNWILSIFSSIYGWVIRRKNNSYDLGEKPVVRLNIPVISVGNLSVGGSGKTPMVDAVATYFIKKNRRLAIVSRAYKARAKEPMMVNLSEPNACEIFGDEPCLLQSLQPKSQVFVGEKKSEIALFAEGSGDYNLLIVDDGFQHRALARKVDIVLIDASEKIEHAGLLPQGRFREGFDSLKRAQVVVLTKCNLASPEQLQFWQSKLQNFEYFKANTILSRVSPLKDFSKTLPNPDQQFKVALISALAKNDVYRQSVQTELKCEIVAHEQFPDHHLYTEGELKLAVEKFKKAGADAVLTTAKDAVKLKAHWNAELPMWVTHVGIQFHDQQEERFYAKVASLLV